MHSLTSYSPQQCLKPSIGQLVRVTLMAACPVADWVANRARFRSFGGREFDPAAVIGIMAYCSIDNCLSISVISRLVVGECRLIMMKRVDGVVSDLKTGVVRITCTA